ncbi:MAG: glycosyltransferase, partial [Gammaproteobacteria bacterium]|nr:glycosyltransferase [Gammaproteobacteria bacterium]
PRLMERIDWVVVPSIWWENSPLVIQEAMKFGRPVICADIGGMAEKVSDRRNGLHFRARNPFDLAARIEEAATTEGLWDTLYDNTTPALSIAAQTDQLMSFYRVTSNVPL